MQEFITNLLQSWNVPANLVNILAAIILAVVVAALCVISELFGRWVIIKVFFRIADKSHKVIFQIIKKRGLLEQMIHLITPLLINFYAASFQSLVPIISHVASIYLVIVLVMILNSLLKVLDDFYQTYDISKKRPITPVLQIIKIVMIIIFITIIISSWLNQSPLVLLSGIGAFAAIISLIFKDTILGFVAGIQLTNNNMVRIGDWIEMPDQNVNGIIEEITLISLKVHNFDNTVTSVPAYALISNSFKNWQAMIASGSRRMMRAVNVDLTSIGFCSEEMLDQFATIDFLSQYIVSKRLEYTSDNIATATDQPRLTNLGVFRIYMEKYLNTIPKIRKDMPILVRQLPAAGQGVPLEICAFITETAWVPFENVQSDLFDHVFAIAPYFGLRLFQSPSGYDLKNLPPKPPV